MALINGKWHDYKSRQQVIDKLRAYIVPRVKARASLSSEEKRDLSAYIKEFDRISAIHRGETDLLFFAYYYFGEDANPENSGNWIPQFNTQDFDTITDNAPEFHHEICGIMNVVSNSEKNKRVVVAAPRSHAKSSFLSKAFPIHELVYRKRKYIMLISETPSVASANLDWLKIQLTGNEALARDFGRLLSAKQQMNPKDNQSEFIAWEDLGEGKQKLLTLVQAASSGQALRGRNWNGVRPDLIICDDVDSEKNNNTEELREDLKSWFRQVVVPLGDPEGKKTAIVFMGTTVSASSLLIDVMKHRSDFESKRYQAILEWPERMDLWEECRKLYQNREDPRSAKTAELFYIANKEEMDRGSKVLWPTVQPLYKLMTWKYDNGSKAFNTEYMNNPIDEESMIFNPNKFLYWDDVEPNKSFKHDEYVISMGVDMAMGKEKGDYSAITVIARHKDSGVNYVIDSYGDKITPEKFLQVIVEKVKEYQPDVIGAEAVAAQEFFVDNLKQSLSVAGYPAHKRVKKIYQRSRKELRIESMAPDIEVGKIKFCRRHFLLLEQFERYGSGFHDDLPDSMEIAISVSKNNKRKLENKPLWM
jgi:predicted phage terminase large subunit-like protein